ncbi:hypothetical protein NW801_16235 [Brevibacillus laterosporus]|uniref:Uncharacterized protein n=1 Tax=Brevibacillus halotolerans TaxID=1507437 RepID=A0ABT4HZU0_9BACL|nr:MULTISPECIES: hypothetical protein [Brevibacillus]MCR8986578.1 hypothetical protein [Brevibacillus laterosporus]MCZ0832313.1 hypothetical protein [Brevibacillus halotolerans]GIO03681.1 hypothetical protein J5TS2_43490 [Brevibacillus halotolerans]
MFHPIIYDNIKVVLEGAVYDHDLDGDILVINRVDAVDLAKFGRYFHIQFHLLSSKEDTSKHKVTAEIQLSTELADIASEQLEQTLAVPMGCRICIHFDVSMRDVRYESVQVIDLLNEIWGHRPHITQQVMFTVDEHQEFRWPPEQFQVRIKLDFHRKIDEGNIPDINEIVAYCIESLRLLEEREA